MTTLDEIAARADVIGRCLRANPNDCYDRGDLDEAVIAAREDVPRLVAALRAVEAVHVREDSESFYNDFYGNSRSKLVYYCGTCMDDEEEPYSWPCPTITAIKDALGS